jgi:hypothetical protein
LREGAGVFVFGTLSIQSGPTLRQSIPVVRQEEWLAKEADENIRLDLTCKQTLAYYQGK